MKRIIGIMFCLAAILMCSSAYAAPTAVFDNLTDGGTYYTYLLSEVEIGGTGEKAEIYVDGAFKESSSGLPASFDLTDIHTGARKIKAVVYDSDSNSAETEITVNVTEACEHEEYSYDMNDFDEEIITGSKSFNTDVSGNGETGYFGIKSVDSDKGLSAVVGIDEPNEGKTASAWIGFSGKNSKKLNFKADIYADAAADFSFYLRGSAGNISSTDITFKKDGYIYFSGKQNNGIDKLKYEEKTWYSIEYLIDAENHTYSFIIDGKPIVLNYRMKNQNFDVINSVRVTAPKTNEVRTFMAVDNASAAVSADMPYVYAVTAGESGTDFNAGYIDVAFTGSVGISELDMTLNGKNPAESCELIDSNVIRVTLKNRLFSNTEYSLVINSGITANVTGTVSTAAIPSELIFKTNPAAAEYVSYSVEGTQFNCELKNYTDADITLYLIEGVYSGNKLTEVKCTPVSVSANSTQAVSYTAAGTGSRIAVLNGVLNASAVSEKLFVCE